MEDIHYCTPDFAVTEFANRRVLDEIKMVVTAFDCVLPDNSAIYCSSDVTTGKRYYEMLLRYEVGSQEELEAKLGPARSSEIVKAIIRDNVERGRKFTENIRQRGHVNLINPGPFTAPNFEQQHYHYLWEWVIVKKVNEARFNDDWEYSNGCTLEYAIATRKGIARLDHAGNFIDLPQAIHKIEGAISELAKNGIQARMLQANLAKLKALPSEDEAQLQRAREADTKSVARC